MKKILISVVLVLFLLSCSTGYITPDFTHKFETTFTNETVQEIKYKYEISHFKTTDGVEGLSKVGSLEPTESISLLDMKYGKQVLGRSATIYLLVDNNKVYELVLWTDSSIMPKGNVTILTDEILKAADDELQNNGPYQVMYEYTFNPTDKDLSFFN